MKRNLTIIISALVLITSCKSKEALNYSEKIVAKEKSLEAAIKETDDKVADFNRENKMDSIVTVSERMISLVDSKLKEIKNEAPPNVKESENFKKATIDYFEYIKGIFYAYMSYGKASTEKEKSAEMNKIKDVLAKQSGAIEKIKKAQKKFADANGFKVQ